MNYFSHFSSKTYFVGTQKNRLNKTVLLTTQNICFELMAKKIINIFSVSARVRFLPF